MSQLLEAAEYLTIPELLHVLGKKLGVECTKLQKYNPPAASITSLEVEVSNPSSIQRLDLGSDRNRSDKKS